MQNTLSVDTFPLRYICCSRCGLTSLDLICHLGKQIHDCYYRLGFPNFDFKDTSLHLVKSN